jgi:pimeloyl-ACP methyl ester carboxylesterase
VLDQPGPPGAPVLVLLHGLAATAALNWFPALGPLGRHYRVLAMDLRGHGRGVRSSRQFRLADCADDVAALADVLGVERVFPVGYSMGGPVAMLTWHRHRDRVRGLVLCATSGSFRGSSGESLFMALLPAVGFAARATPAASRRWLASRMVDARMGDGPFERWAASELRHGDPAAIIEAGASTGRFSARAWLSEIDVPSAVVVTENDGLVPPAAQRALAATIPGATAHPVAGDHMVCVARPDVFIPALADACWSVTTRARLRGPR